MSDYHPDHEPVQVEAMEPDGSPATLRRTREALVELGGSIEAVEDGGVFLATLPPALARELEREGFVERTTSNGVTVSAEMP